MNQSIPSDSAGLDLKLQWVRVLLLGFDVWKYGTYRGMGTEEGAPYWTTGKVWYGFQVLVRRMEYGTREGNLEPWLSLSLSSDVQLFVFSVIVFAFNSDRMQSQ